MARRERLGAPPGDQPVEILQQRLHEHLQRARDDDRHRRGHLANLLVALHDLLDAGLQTSALIADHEMDAF